MYTQSQILPRFRDRDESRSQWTFTLPHELYCVHFTYVTGQRCFKRMFIERNRDHIKLNRFPVELHLEDCLISAFSRMDRRKLWDRVYLLTAAGQNFYGVASANLPSLLWVVSQPTFVKNDLQKHQSEKEISRSQKHFFSPYPCLHHKSDILDYSQKDVNRRPFHTFLLMANISLVSFTLIFNNLQTSLCSVSTFIIVL